MSHHRILIVDNGLVAIALLNRLLDGMGMLQIALNGFDVDHYTVFNDRDGRPAGDRTVRERATCRQPIQRSMPPGARKEHAPVRGRWATWRTVMLLQPCTNGGTASNAEDEMKVHA